MNLKNISISLFGLFVIIVCILGIIKDMNRIKIIGFFIVYGLLLGFGFGLILISKNRGE